MSDHTNPNNNNNNTNTNNTSNQFNAFQHIFAHQGPSSPSPLTNADSEPDLQQLHQQIAFLLGQSATPAMPPPPFGVYPMAPILPSFTPPPLNFSTSSATVAGYGADSASPPSYYNPVTPPATSAFCLEENLYRFQNQEAVCARTVHINGLPPELTQKELRRILLEHGGEVLRVRVQGFNAFVMKRQREFARGQRRGIRKEEGSERYEGKDDFTGRWLYSFVEFASAEAAQKALREINGLYVQVQSEATEAAPSAPATSTAQAEGEEAPVCFRLQCTTVKQFIRNSFPTDAVVRIEKKPKGAAAHTKEAKETPKIVVVSPCLFGWQQEVDGKLVPVPETATLIDFVELTRSYKARLAADAEAGTKGEQNTTTTTTTSSNKNATATAATTTAADAPPAKKETVAASQRGGCCGGGGAGGCGCSGKNCCPCCRCGQSKEKKLKRDPADKERPVEKEEACGGCCGSGCDREEEATATTATTTTTTPSTRHGKNEEAVGAVRRTHPLLSQHIQQLLAGGGGGDDGFLFGDAAGVIGCVRDVLLGRRGVPAETGGSAAPVCVFSELRALSQQPYKGAEAPEVAHGRVTHVLEFLLRRVLRERRHQVLTGGPAQCGSCCCTGAATAGGAALPVPKQYTQLYLFVTTTLFLLSLWGRNLQGGMRYLQLLFEAVEAIPVGRLTTPAGGSGHNPEVAFQTYVVQVLVGVGLALEAVQPVLARGAYELAAARARDVLGQRSAALEEALRHEDTADADGGRGGLLCAGLRAYVQQAQTAEDITTVPSFLWSCVTAAQEELLGRDLPRFFAHLPPREICVFEESE